MWQLYGHEFLTLALIHFMAVILPGPDFVITVRQSVRYGYLIGCLTAIGIGVGISVHVFYTLVGIGFLIQQSEWLMSLIRTAGAAYLVYLGWQCLRSQPNTNIEINGSVDSDTPSLFKAFTMGFLTNALNPKATIFFSGNFYDNCKYDHTNESSGFLWGLDVYGQCHLVYGSESTVCSAYCT